MFYIRHTPLGKQTYEQRKETIERVFADAKEKHGIDERAERAVYPVLEKDGNGAAQHHAQYPVREDLRKLYGNVIPQIDELPPQEVKHRGQ